ncbi:MAG TPA: hypothetical protein VIL46_17730, partial [Gemmataceae bacterium]
MLLLYTFAAGLLGLVHRAVLLRARRLEKRYGKVALEAEKLARDLQVKGGTGKPDPFANARRHYRLGQVVEARDRLERKYDRWETWAERLAHRRERLRRWNGKLIPYLFGAADAALVVLALHWTGLGESIDVHSLKESVVA